MKMKIASPATNASQRIAMEMTAGFQLRCIMWIRELQLVDDINILDGVSERLVVDEYRRKY